MTKKKSNTSTKEVVAEETQSFESEDYTRERPKRRKVYERPSESEIPAEVTEYFAKDDYALRLVRWAIKGQEDFRYLNRRLQEGYEFVKAEELPDSYKRALRMRDTQVTKGLVTNGGDLCLMKIDSDLKRSREEYFANRAQQEQDAVNINVLGKKGLINAGSKSKVMLREPSFGD